MPATTYDLEAVRERLRTDTPLWGRECGVIIDKQRQQVPFILNEGQLELDRRLEEQRAAGKPMRAAILKARQLGFSTYAQGKLIQRATMTANYHTAVVAHDRETGAKLYRIGQRFYTHLPDEIKPEIASHRRSQYLHFGEKGDAAWIDGGRWPDSTYYVDTAAETDAGRGGTFAAIHGSEVAFWPDMETKLIALQAAVPDDPETLLLLESTANGHNAFKDFWDKAVRGENDYIPFFWPWWKDPSYSLSFPNEREREAFVVGQGPYGEDEPDLLERFDLTLEQLHWRRKTIANKSAGRVDLFKQEYPSFAEEAFLTTGHRVFDPKFVTAIPVSITDPRQPTGEHPGPELGSFRATQERPFSDRSGGRIMRPEEPEWVPDPAGIWRIWHPRKKPIYRPDPDDRFVIGVDVSGGERKNTKDPAWNAIQVIDHKTREQVAEYRSRADEMTLAEQCFLAAQFFNDAWLAIEITGGWGGAVARRCGNDWNYPFMYHRERLDDLRGKEQDTLGWDTTGKTKPHLIANGQEMLRDGSHGVKSALLADEYLHYIRNETGKTEPEPGHFADLLMAYLIGQFVANLLPMRRPKNKSPRQRMQHRPANPVTGY